jgi:hypothetical protein
MKNHSAKADLIARISALTELEPVSYRFHEEKPIPVAAEDSVEYH